MNRCEHKHELPIPYYVTNIYDSLDFSLSHNRLVSESFLMFLKSFCFTVGLRMKWTNFWIYNTRLRQKFFAVTICILCSIYREWFLVLNSDKVLLLLVTEFQHSISSCPEKDSKQGFFLKNRSAPSRSNNRPRWFWCM